MGYINSHTCLKFPMETVLLYCPLLLKSTAFATIFCLSAFLKI